MNLARHKEILSVNCILKLRRQWLVHGSWPIKSHMDQHTSYWSVWLYFWHTILLELSIIKEDIECMECNPFRILINGRNCLLKCNRNST